MAWRLAKSLDKLRQQVNAAAPNRRKSSDGTIGDAAHRSRPSDHNPDSKGVVRALDITHDPMNGMDAGKLAEALRVSRDPRIKYIISNRRIASSQAVHGEAAWVWRHYSGANPHDKHCHISVVSDARADDTRAWQIDGGVATQAPVTPAVEAVAVPTNDRRTRMGRAILKFEARRDSAGRLAVYSLPANDGGGAYEVAGINVRYHPQQAQLLRSLIQAGRYAEAESSAVEYILKYTDLAATWTTNAGVEFYLRDCIFNRGPRGAALILQRALGVQQDGQIGPATRDALSKVGPEDLLNKLRKAREDYEREVVGTRANFAAGLTNRWNNALVEARKFASETPTATQRTVTGAGAGGAAAGAGAAVAHGAQQGWGWSEWGQLVLAIIAFIGLALIVYYWWRNRKVEKPAALTQDLLAQPTPSDQAAVTLAPIPDDEIAVAAEPKPRRARKRKKAAAA